MAIEYWVGPLAQRTPAGVGAVSVSYPTVPGGILANDLLIIFGGISIASTTLFTTTAGWSVLQASLRAVTSSPTSKAIQKWAVGGESGSVSVASATSSTAAMAMVVIRGADLTTPIDVTPNPNYNSATAATAFTIPELTTTKPGCLILVWGGTTVASGAWNVPTNPATFTEEIDNNTVIPSPCLHALLWSGSGPTGAINLTRTSSVRGEAFAVAIRPASAPSANPAAFLQFI